MQTHKTAPFQRKESLGCIAAIPIQDAYISYESNVAWPGDGDTLLIVEQVSGSLPLPGRGPLAWITAYSVSQEKEIWRCTSNDLWAEDSLAVSSDGQLVAIWDSKGGKSLRVFRLSTMTLLAELEVDELGKFGARFSTDQARLEAGTSQNPREWTLPDLLPLRRDRSKRAGGLRNDEGVPSGRGYDGRVADWSNQYEFHAFKDVLSCTPAGEEPKIRSTQANPKAGILESPTVMELSRDSRRLVTAYYSPGNRYPVCTLEFWQCDLAGRFPLPPVQFHSIKLLGWVGQSIGLSNDGNRLAVVARLGDAVWLHVFELPRLLPKRSSDAMG